MTVLTPKSSLTPVKYKAYIGGEWVEAAGGATFESEDPFSGDIWALVPRCGKAEVDAAADAAHKAFVSGAWFEAEDHVHERPERSELSLGLPIHTERSRLRPGPFCFGGRRGGVNHRSCWCETNLRAGRINPDAALFGGSVMSDQATATMEYCANEAMQVFGGAGYLRGAKVERIYRETKVMSIGGGSVEIMKDLAARQMGL